MNKIDPSSIMNVLVALLFGLLVISFMQNAVLHSQIEDFKAMGEALGWINYEPGNDPDYSWNIK